MKNIHLIGHAFHGKTALLAQALASNQALVVCDDYPTVFIVDDSPLPKTIEINEKKYVEIITERPNIPSRRLAAYEFEISNQYAHLGEKQQRQLNRNIDVVTEFELIERKQSRLSQKTRITH